MEDEGGQRVGDCAAEEGVVRIENWNYMKLKVESKFSFPKLSEREVSALFVARGNHLAKSSRSNCAWCVDRLGLHANSLAG